MDEVDEVATVSINRHYWIEDPDGSAIRLTRSADKVRVEMYPDDETSEITFEADLDAVEVARLAAWLGVG